MTGAVEINDQKREEVGRDRLAKQRFGKASVLIASLPLTTTQAPSMAHSNSGSSSPEPEAGNKRKSSSLLDTLTKGGRKKPKRLVFITIEIPTLTFITMVVPSLNPISSHMLVSGRALPADSRPLSASRECSSGVCATASKRMRMMKTRTKHPSMLSSLFSSKPNDIIYRAPDDLVECVKGYKHIAAHVLAFKTDMENFQKDSETGQLDELIKLVSVQHIFCAYIC